jgi:hypothetical protein
MLMLMQPCLAKQTHLGIERIVLESSVVECYVGEVFSHHVGAVQAVQAMDMTTDETVDENI